MKNLTVCHLTNKGKIRKNNEDNLFINGEYFPEEKEDMLNPIEKEWDSEHACLFAVFDGVGGGYYGEKASFISAKEMSKHFFDIREKKISSERFFNIICQKMNEQVCMLEEEYLANMGSTVSALLFFNNQMTVCNLGDSPVFRFRNTGIERIHEEHTNRKFLLENGIKRKPELMQCLGITEEEMRICPYIKTFDLEKGDQYLVCSDGVTDMLSDEKISEIVNGNMGQSKKISLLLENTLENGGKDNITMILIKVN